jgi:hypothetical protein
MQETNWEADSYQDPTGITVASVIIEEWSFFFMLMDPCIWVNVKMFQKDDTFCTVFYSLQTALHVSGETFIHHQELE